MGEISVVSIIGEGGGVRVSSEGVIVHWEGEVVVDVVVGALVVVDEVEGLTVEVATVFRVCDEMGELVEVLVDGAEGVEKRYSQPENVITQQMMVIKMTTRNFIMNK